MSLLKTLKGTFKSVQEDVSEGFKSFTTAVDKPSQPVTHVRRIPPTKIINYEAGGELLHKHEGIWKDLYDFSEETGRKAQDVDVGIAKLYAYCEKQSEILTRLHKESGDLPVLLNQLQEITDTLANVEEACDKVEAVLVQMENICEEQEFLRNQASHHKQLAVYKMKKEHELDSYKVHLARSHAAKMEQMNKKREFLLHERQAAFEEQFSQDVDYFKKHGKAGRLPDTPESQKKLDLADVEIEEDQNALDAFLDSSASDVTVDDAKKSPDTETPSDCEEAKVEVAPEITSPSESEDRLVTTETKESGSSDTTEVPTSEEAASVDSDNVNNEAEEATNTSPDSSQET